tara:strand:+ start:2502 stop:2828 length:327 start_codon:yes stop_codon:yes gene_type:complete
MKPKEVANVDYDRLNELYTQLGQSNAEDIVCRAMEELALRLTHCDKLYRDKALGDLHKSAKSLVAIAGHLTICIDCENTIALAARVARLLRIGEESLAVIWDLQDITI